jgi:hypothetical protein
MQVTPAAVEPGDRAFDDPTLGQLYEPLGLRGSVDDFGFDTGQDFGERVAEDRPLIGAVGEELRAGRIASLPAHAKPVVAWSQQADSISGRAHWF